MTTFIKRANDFFLKKDFVKALEFYKKFCETYPGYEWLVKYNIDYACRAIGYSFSSDKETKVVDISNILVSVIIPAHNVEKYIKSCIESVLNQTHSKIEVLVVDDGSTDNTIKILEDIYKTDERLRIIRNISASGNSGTPRNQAICLARGDYIFFVDADDWIENDMLQKHLLQITSYDADISTSSGFRRSDDDFRTVENIELKDFYRYTNDFDEIEKIYKLPQFPIVWYRGYKRKFLLENSIYFAETKTAADIPFSVKSLYYANKIVPVVGAFYNYRFDRPGSTIERRRGLGAFSLFESYQIIFDFILNPERKKKSMSEIIFNKFLGDCFYNMRLLSPEYEKDFKRSAINLIRKNFREEEILDIEKGLNKFWKDFFFKIKCTNYL